MPFEQPKTFDKKEAPKVQREPHVAIQKKSSEKQEPMRNRVKHAVSEMEKVWQLNIDDTKKKIETGEKLGEDKKVIDLWRFDLNNFESNLQRLKADSFQKKLTKAENLHRRMLIGEEDIDPQDVLQEYDHEKDSTFKAYEASRTKQRPDGIRELLDQLEYLRGRQSEIEDILDRMK